ncbi:MAG: hypothetical protein IJH32_02085 [Ruminococcus sp.]|nr:hypothetical protein [Ruminococcus sp.]
MKNKGRRFSDTKEYKEIIYEAESQDASIPTSDDDPDEDVVEYRRKEAQKVRERDERLKKKNDEKMEKIIRKRQKQERHRERKVLSYEDMPLEDVPERETKKKKSKLNRKRVLIAIAILLLLSLAVFMFVNADVLSFDSVKNFFKYGLFNENSDESFPIEVQGENISSGNFDSMGQYLVFASDSRLATVNNYGRTVYTSSMALSTPVLVTSKDYIMVYNLGGTGFEIDTLDKNILSSTAENKIVVADISDSGTYALVTQYDGYLSKLYVYNKENEQIFAYSYADYYVTGVSLNSSGTMAAVSGISALDGVEISAVYIHDFTEKDPVVFKEFPGDFLYDISYLSDSMVCAVGSTSAYGIKAHSGDVETTSYEGRTLTAYDINTDTDTFSLSLSRSGDGRNCDIYNFNSSGRLSNHFSTDLRVISLSTYKNHVAVLSADTVYLYAKDGRKISEKGAGLDTHAVSLFTSSDAYVLSSSNITTLKL